LELASSAWIVGEFEKLEKLVTSKMDEFDISIAADEIYRVSWTIFCDWYLEMMKVLVDSGNQAWAHEAGMVVRHCFRRMLTMLHPLIPFVTEEIYQKLPLVQRGTLLATSAWDSKPLTVAADATPVATMMELVSSVRSVKATLQIPHKRIRIAVSQKLSAELTALLQELARADIVDAGEIPELLALRKPFSAGTLVCEVEGKERYRERLEADMAGHRQTIASLEAKLGGAFATQAKPDVVEKERERLEQSKAAAREIERELTAL
jgi:valyl-tRNA synthetase